MDALLIWASALLLAAVFAYAAYGKLSAWDEFAGVVHNFQLLPRWLNRPFAATLPFVEGLVALALLVPQTRVGGSLAAFVLLALFVAAIAINLRRGRTHIDCGCFRANVAQPISIWMVVRNLTLMAIALVAVLGTPATDMDASRWVIAGVSALTLFLLYLATTMVTAPLPPTYEDNFYASRTGA
ncbi:MauE/DoxX family redox-associated membrane protein [Pseudomonas aeruginosa]|uniref:MauE/DoxX family redox-associated membrane protein n=1 Tax=Pseudomonas aeruginosa TaxID=287 RepID=UPI000EAC1EFE|nr:MauE/DoxX family redox-associated membrane protein [Pseudomonas aeruginosa]NNB83812.1 methylamine utilization protein MauE [Pseudomonas aeruginosa]